MSFRGKRIVISPRRITINALKDEREAEEIFEQLRQKINETWQKRDEIKSKQKPACVPDPLEIFAALPQSNCAECGQASCMSFATVVAAGVRTVDECPRLRAEDQSRLKGYLDFFR